MNIKKNRTIGIRTDDHFLRLLESAENDKMESSINDDWLSDYMAFVVDPAIFEKNNLIRLGYDAEIIKDLI